MTKEIRTLIEGLEDASIGKKFTSDDFYFIDLDKDDHPGIGSSPSTGTFFQYKDDRKVALHRWDKELIRFLKYKGIEFAVTNPSREDIILDGENYGRKQIFITQDDAYKLH
jgi:hypothetical protein